MLEKDKSWIHMNMHLEYRFDDEYEYICLDELFLMFRYNHMFILIFPCLCFCHYWFTALDEII